MLFSGSTSFTLFLWLFWSELWTDKYHGVILLPEGLIESIPEVYALLQVIIPHIQSATFFVCHCASVGSTGGLTSLCLSAEKHSHIISHLYFIVLYILQEIHGLQGQGVSVDNISSQLSPWASALFEFLPPFIRRQVPLPSFSYLILCCISPYCHLISLFSYFFQLLLQRESDDSAQLSQVKIVKVVPYSSLPVRIGFLIPWFNCWSDWNRETFSSAGGNRNQQATGMASPNWVFCQLLVL